jgi:hypothetical protein
VTTPPTPLADAARLVALGLRLRLEAVAHFAAEAHEPDNRHALSAAEHHAGALRRYADAAPVRLRTYMEGGRPQ